MDYLTSLDFLRVGERFPPINQVNRLDTYAKNRQIFNGDHENVYREQFKRIERVIGNFDNVVNYSLVINYQKLISLKIADFLLGEPPKIIAGEKESKEQKSVEKIKENTELHNTAYQVAIDISRFGDGLFLIYQDSSFGQIDITRPEFWFPIVRDDNIKRILNHVIAWTYKTKDFFGNDIDVLKAQVHYKGYYEETEYLLETGINTTIIRQYTETKRVNTGLSDFAVIQVSNLITSDRVTGMDDYCDLDSIISEIEVRLSQISKILDKHAAPSVSGPLTSLQQNADTGEWSLKMGNFFARDSSEDAEVKYITWDGQLEANFKMLEKLINMLYTISEMGSAIFGDMTNNTGQVASGTALRRLMISALAKVNRIKMRFDPALKKAIKLASELGGKDIVRLTDVPISITWMDGLPSDPVEESTIMSTRTGGKATMSVKRALTLYDGMNEEDAENEMLQIDEEENKLNPIKNSGYQFDNKDDNNMDDEEEIKQDN